MKFSLYPVYLINTTISFFCFTTPQTMFTTGSPTKTSKPTSACDCSEAKLQEVRQRADSRSSSVTIDCNLTLNSNDVITKRLIFEGNSATDITFNGNGALINGGEGTFNFIRNSTLPMILIRPVSRDGETTWERPSNVTIRNCNIIGSVRVATISVSRSGTREPGYVNKIRRYAPTKIVFDGITVTGIGFDVFYFEGGVTDSKLINSKIKGKAKGVPLYVDAESRLISIKNNRFEIKTESREVIAIDASEYDTIMNNSFVDAYNGGIFLYRNCGERNRVRYTTPNHNQIINNVFVYTNRLVPAKKAIWVGSRDGDHWGCPDDDDFDQGSGKSNYDHATDNVIAQNQIVNRSVDALIEVRRPSINKNNYKAHNNKVSTPIQRPAGCFVPDGYKQFIVSGESIDVYLSRRDEKPECGSFTYTCNNGQMTRNATAGCEVTQHPFAMPIEGKNAGGHQLIGCPTGKKIVGVWVACHLENSRFKDDKIPNVTLNHIQVIRTSDDPRQGLCWIGDTKLYALKKPIDEVLGTTMVEIGCKERDDNGGDCRVEGLLYCR